MDAQERRQPLLRQTDHPSGGKMTDQSMEERIAALEAQIIRTGAIGGSIATTAIIFALHRADALPAGFAVSAVEECRLLAKTLAKTAPFDAKIATDIASILEATISSLPARTIN